jgi:hypothetical protein
MADLDDGPEQTPLGEALVRETILRLLPHQHFDLLISHSPAGEYTRHLRHEEIGAAVITLWHAGQLSADELWAFAYEDGDKRHLPEPIRTAPHYQVLPERIWRRKHKIITGTYGFAPDSFEASTTPRAEAFWQFTNPDNAQAWLDHSGGMA